MLSLRIRNDTAYLFIRQAPSEADARTWLETEGKRFREPVAVLVSGGDEAPMRLPPTKLMHRPWTMQSQWHADGANIWRGYATNTRGVVKFRRDRFIVEVNAPSLEDAITVARGVDSLLHT